MHTISCLISTFYFIVLMFNQNITTMENWVRIKQAPENYFVSDFGRIKIVRHDSEQIKLGSKNRAGYRQVSFSGVQYYVHFLVLDNFTSKPEWAECVNHKKGVKDDNRLSEIEWSTYALNNKHAYDTGLKIHWTQTPKELVLKIYQFKKDGLKIRDIIKEVPLSRDVIKGIYSGQNWKYEYLSFFGRPQEKTGKQVGGDRYNALHESKVLEVYHLKKEGFSVTQIGVITSIKRGTVSPIYHGKNWKHLYQQHFG